VKQVVLGRLARREITDAASFYEARTPGLGSAFTDRVAEVLERIKLLRKAIKSSMAMYAG
jgi:hypothetical protein